MRGDPINFVDPSGLSRLPERYVWGACGDDAGAAALIQAGVDEVLCKLALSGLFSGAGLGPTFGGPSPGLGGGSTGAEEAAPPSMMSPEVPQNLCSSSGMTTLIGAASSVGGFVSAAGDVGQIVGGVVFFVNPVLGGAIYGGSRVIGLTGQGLVLGSAILDASFNGNTGGLVAAGGEFAGQAIGGAAFSTARGAMFTGRVARNARGQFARHPGNLYNQQIRQSGGLIGGQIGGQICD